MKRIGMAAALAAGVGAAVYGYGYGGVGSAAELLAYARSFPYTGLALFLLVFCLNAASLPSLVPLAVSGMVLPLPEAVLWMWSAETAGCTAGFFCFRFLFQERARRLLCQKGWDTKVDACGTAAAVLTARMLPFSPKLAVTLWAAVSRMHTREYVLANAAGKLPYVVLCAAGGEAVVSQSLPAGWTAGLFVLAIVSGMAVHYWEKRQRK